jgi:hypothetical protein
MRRDVPRTESRNEPPVKVEIKEGKATTATVRAWTLLWQRLLGDKAPSATNTAEKERHERD